MFLPLTKIAKELSFTGFRYKDLKHFLIREGYLKQEGKALYCTYKNGFGSNYVYSSPVGDKITPKFTVEQVYEIIRNSN